MEVFALCTIQILQYQLAAPFIFVRFSHTLLFLEAQLRGDAEADARLSDSGLQPLAHGVVRRIDVLRK